MNKNNEISKTQKRINNTYQIIKKFFRIIIGKEIYFPIDKKLKKEILGNHLAEWVISSNSLDKDKVVYSFGVGTDISFDLDLIKKYGCQVYAFDPTPKSVKWIKEQNLPFNFKFMEYGVSDKNELITFYPPENQDHVSYSTKKNDEQVGIQLPVYRLKTIMENLGHKKIDLLKMDIEGAEYEVIKDLITSNIDVKQLLIEFHHRFDKNSKKDTLNAINGLRNFGFNIFYISPTGEEYSFIKLKD